MNREKVWFSFFMILALTLNFGFFYGQGVGRIGVATSGCTQNVFWVTRNSWQRLPRSSIAFKKTGECRVNVVIVHEPNEHGAHKAAVLTFFVHVVVGGSQAHIVLVRRTPWMQR